MPSSATMRGGLLGPILPRSIRPTTAGERKESRRNSLALFVLGLVLILVGAGFDPSRRPF